MQKISGPAASQPQVIPLVASFNVNSNGRSHKAQNNLPQAYALLGTSLSVPSTNLLFSTSTLYEVYKLDHVRAGGGYGGTYPPDISI